MKGGRRPSHGHFEDLVDWAWVGILVVSQLCRDARLVIECDGADRVAQKIENNADGPS